MASTHDNDPSRGSARSLRVYPLAQLQLSSAPVFGTRFSRFSERETPLARVDASVLTGVAISTAGRNVAIGRVVQHAGIAAMFDIASNGPEREATKCGLESNGGPCRPALSSAADGWELRLSKIRNFSNSTAFSHVALDASIERSDSRRRPRYFLG